MKKTPQHQNNCERLDQILAHMSIYFKKNKEQIRVSKNYKGNLYSDLDQIHEYGILLGYLLRPPKKIEFNPSLIFIKTYISEKRESKIFNWTFWEHLVLYIAVLGICASISLTLKYRWVTYVPVFWMLYGFAQYGVRLYFSLFRINTELITKHYKDIQPKHFSYIWNQYGIVVNQNSIRRYKKDFIKLSPKMSDLMQKHLLYEAFVLISFIISIILGVFITS